MATAKPNMRELMDATGVDASTASEILYGVVGANTDTRNWDAIMSSSDPLSTARQATAQMYSEPTATAETVARSTYDRDLAGASKETEYARYENPTGETAIVQASDGSYAIVAGNGLALRAGYQSLEQAQKQAENFGIGSDSSENLLVTGGGGSGTTQQTQVDTAANTQTAQQTSSGPTITTQTSTQGPTSGRVVDGVVVPDWVDPNYEMSYVVNAQQGKIRAPLKSELDKYMDLSQSEYVDLVYGVVGSSKDVRNWDAILSSSDPKTALYEATKQLQDVYVSGQDPSLVGKTGTTLADAQNNPNVSRLEGLSDNKLVIINNELYLTTADGTILSGVTPSNAAKLGVTQEQIDEYLATSGLAAGPQQEYVSRWQNVGYQPSSLANENFLRDYTSTGRTNQNTFTQQTATNTATQNTTAGPGEFVSVQPKPQIVTQQVQPTQYFNQSFQADPSLDQMAGTFDKPLQTADLSAVPTTVSYKTHSAGTTGLIDPTLVAPTLGSTGTQQVIYGNNLGQTLIVTEVNGAPLTYVPPGFTRKGTPQEVAQQEATGQTAVGNTGTTASTTMSKGGAVGFASGGQASKVLEAKYRIASMNGYNGPKTNEALNAFANASPAMAAKFNAIGAALAKGGYMRKGYTSGGLEDGSTAFSLEPGTTVGQTTTDPTTGTTYKWNGSAWEVQGSTTPVELDPFQQMQANLVNQTMQPMQANVQFLEPNANQFIPVDAGQALPIAPFAEAATAQTVQQAELPTTAPAASMQAAAVTPEVQQLTAQTQAAQGNVSEQAQVQAAQQQGTSVAGMQAAQGVATMVDSPAAREIQQGELISGAANAEKAAAFNEQIQAAEATPSKQATVQGQLETLMAQFEGGNRPAWAAASMRNAMSTLAARGLGASSMAGQAVIQAAMEAALPIAQMDAQIQAQFESQNLSNRQQRAMLAAQQRAEFLGMEFTQEFQARVQNSARIGDIANMNFTAEQQIALENSRAANTMNLNNLSNRQALVMAEAAALSQLDMANLNNRQQAAVQNAQNFMQMDMTNLGNMQQTALFNAQQNIQALFTDQAAENAARQFNASSENQTNQFFANLSNQTSQFNASQQNAMDQFNINSVNALREFNSNLQQQRDMFNAQNGLVIAQANAQWRQNLDTINTATLNQSNSDFAKTINALTSTNLDQIWQRERDLMSFAFTSSENSMDRALKIILGDKQLESVRIQLDAQEKAARGSLFTRFLFGSGGAGGGGLLGKLIPGLG